MDFLSLLTGGSDNLYKYLFIGGLGLIILSLFYPLNKKYEYTCQKDDYNNTVKLLNYDILKFQNSTEQFSQQSNQIIAESERLKKTGENPKRVALLKDSFEKQYALIKSYRDTIDRKKLAIEYSKVKIDTLNEHIRDFTKYEYIFFYAGIVSAIVGIIGWYFRMRSEDSKKSGNP